MARPTRETQARLDCALDVLAVSDRALETLQAFTARTWRRLSKDEVDELTALALQLGIIQRLVRQEERQIGAALSKANGNANHTDGA